MNWKVVLFDYYGVFIMKMLKGYLNVKCTGSITKFKILRIAKVSIVTDRQNAECEHYNKTFFT